MGYFVWMKENSLCMILSSLYVQFGMAFDFLAVVVVVCFDGIYIKVLAPVVVDSFGSGIGT